MQEALEYSLSLTRFSLKLPSGSLTCRERKKRERERERERLQPQSKDAKSNGESDNPMDNRNEYAATIEVHLKAFFFEEAQTSCCLFVCVRVWVWVWVYVCGGACSSNQRHHCFHFSRGFHAPLPFPSRARVGEGMWWPRR